MKIATWNMCLGLFHKRDYVRNLLHENDIDILTLQETELTPEIETKNLQIKGYSLEVENNAKKRRVAIYIKKTITYKRRTDLEKINLHLIILDVETRSSVRIITLYRTFNPQSTNSPRENFKNQLNVISNATTNSTILLGDFNLDENKRYIVDYKNRLLFEDLEELTGHHHYTQHVKEATWERLIENRVKNSVIDHIYCTDNTQVDTIIYKTTAFGDHKLVILCTINEVQENDFKMKRRNWKNYSPKALIQYLNQIQWDNGVEEVQEVWNKFEQEILTVIDKCAPLEEVGVTITRKVTKAMKKMQNRRNYLLKKRKRQEQLENEKSELRALNKSIRIYYFKERRDHIRRKIIPGNNKSLWDAVKIPKDIEPTPLPMKLTKGSIHYGRNEAPAAFSNYFKSKITNLEESLTINEGVWNGERIIRSEEVDFMTPDKVEECMKELKTKNCEGADRIPLRILKD